MNFICKNIVFVCSFVLLLIAFNFNGKAVSWTSIGSPTSGEVLKQNSIIEFNKSFTIEEGETLTINDNVNIKKGIVVTVKGTLKINGALMSIGGSGEDAYIMGGGTLNINSTESYNLRLNNNLHLEDLNIIDLKLGEYYSGQIDKQYTLSLKNVTIEGDFQNGWNAKHVNQPITEIEEGSRVFVKGDLTNNGTINCNGRLVVGTLMDSPDGKTIIKSNGTVTNYGTINIETTPTALAKAQSDNPSLLENSVYYAAITCENMDVGKSSSAAGTELGFINMYDGSLIVQNDLTMWYCSNMYFKRGQSYLDVWGDLYQLDKTYEVFGEEAVIKLEGEGAKAQINVRETYVDYTTLSSQTEGVTRYTHDWELSDAGQFRIDDNITLSVGSYNSGKTEYLDENTFRVSGWKYVGCTPITKKVYNDDYNTMDSLKDDNNYYLEELNDMLLEYTGPDGPAYVELIGTLGDNDLPSGGRVAAEKQREIIQAKIDAYNALNATLDLIETFGEGPLSEEDIKKLNAWFYASDYGQNFVNSSLYIKSGKNYYTYKEYFKDQFNNNWKNNHLKLYHYVLAYMDQNGYEKMYYDDRHNSLSVMLPIELSYFDVAQDGSQVVFEWATESETNNDFFSVEYSIDGVQYKSIATVDGARTSTEKLWYSTSTEADMFDGIVYFRLKQTDFNGASTYSEVRALEVQGEGDDFVIYPNPATTEITIDGGAYSKVYFVDMQSKTYPAEVVDENQYSVGNLPKGLNFVVIVTSKGTVVKQFMVVRDSVWDE